MLPKQNIVIYLYSQFRTHCRNIGVKPAPEREPMPKTQKKTMKKGGLRSAKSRDFKSLFYRKLSETHLFYEVARIIAGELDPAELIKKVITALKKTVPFTDASVYLVKKDLTGLAPFYQYGPMFKGEAIGELNFDYGAPGIIAATGEPLFIDDPAMFKGFFHLPAEKTRPLSYIGVAMKSDNRIIGVMGFSSTSEEAFRVEDFDLLRTVSHLISVGMEKAELFKKTYELARIDELTGLYNYRVLMEKLDEEVRRQIRTGREFSFIMIDIDDFKRINDRYGHLEGSRLIAQMGPLLKAACRTDSTDTCYRYGGEEFAVLLAETDIEEAMAVAERVRKEVEKYPFSIKAAHQSEKVTVSLGVSTMPPGARKNIFTLINEADIALYRSKAEGKNKVTRYSEGAAMPGACAAS